LIHFYKRELLSQQGEEPEYHGQSRAFT